MKEKNLKVLKQKVVYIGIYLISFWTGFLNEKLTKLKQ